MAYTETHRDQRLAGLVKRLADSIYVEVAPLSIEAFVTQEPLPYEQRTDGRRLELEPGDKWGDLFDCGWFHFTGEVPASAAGRDVVLLIDVNGEALVVDAQGNPWRGLTNVNSGYDWSLGGPGKRVLPLLAPAAGGESVDVWADCGCNDLFGELRENGTVKEARIAICNQHLRGLHYDVEVLHELMQQLPADSARRARIRSRLLEAQEIVRDLTDDQARQARAHLAPELAKRGGDPSLTISAIGHAHMDLAWLWPVRETIRKGARTFATTLRLMETYPDYHFGASQPQLFAWMKQHYPTLYAEIKQRVAEGRLEVQGGMWVEADTNTTGGESLVRQLLHGKRFFRDEFGIDVKGLWLPDVFGYSAAVPQLLRGAGLDWFMTQKMSWNQVNRFPHQTFRWVGQDGSEIVSHMLPEETYNSPGSPRALAKAERNFLDKGVSEHCLMLFGIGDGGGGPGEEHVERLARETDLNGLCPVIQEPAQRFFERILPESSRFPRWVGELYLERHQGTYTTQGRNKRFNRQLELALRETELAAARAAWQGGYAYPRAELEVIWKEVLLYQFHDILPGSSITRVYDESRARYAALLDQTLALRGAAEAALYAGGHERLAVNSLSWARTELLQVDGQWRQVTVPPLGEARLADAPLAEFAAPEAEIDRLENDQLRVTLRSDGALCSVWDKVHQREVLALGEPANRLDLWADGGDAWDFAMDYRDRVPDRFSLVESEAVVDGPLAVVRQRYTFGESTLWQELRLRAGSRRLDFATRVDWRERGKMLRASFPLAVNAAEVSCEMQFGHVKRPTHTNTTWDAAKFEICAHRWIDLSDRGYGAALLNDGKYGYQARGHVLDIDLLRSPGHPDPQADLGEHEFTYSLLPHAGDALAAGVVQAGWELNAPLRLVDGAGGGSLLSLDADHVVVEAVKLAEDDDSLIVRLYESHGAWGRARLTLPAGVLSVAQVDLLEERPLELSVVDGQVVLELRPFEVKSLRLRRA